MMYSYAKSMAGVLFNIGAVKLGAFRLKLHEKNPQAPLSPIYLNLRSANNPKPGPLGPAEYREIGQLMKQLVLERKLAFDCIAGIPNAGDPFATALSQAYVQDKPVVRLIKTDSDSERSITGIAEGKVDGLHVLLVDDLITQADSKAEAINVLRSAGGIVTDVVVLVDRQQGGTEGLAELNCRLHSIFTLFGLLDIYVDSGKITADKRQEVFDYLAGN